ncbi:trypsin 3A1-like [Anopheles bellator]|uniref:trypsin 3A1-like n=1 Tax=Anopheles bellator TaxID=139047 RepID=UPI0026498129|nr:trypsin 3A1-like [Anopheles bellator]
MKVCTVLALVFVALSAGSADKPGFLFDRRKPESKGVRRIVGGTNANIVNYPYQLSLMRDGRHFCGSSIIATRWALSAAHCTWPIPPPGAVRLLGGTSDNTQGGVTFDVDQIVNHPNYEEQTIRNDVSVLHTTSAMIGRNVAPIPLDSTGAFHKPGTRAVLSGWGLTENLVTTNILQSVEIPIISTIACKLSLWQENANIYPDMLCAGELGRAPCSADSGGPLVIDGKQVGIVSWGSLKCLGELPDVFARIGYPTIRSFITNITGV